MYRNNQPFANPPKLLKTNYGKSLRMHMYLLNI